MNRKTVAVALSAVVSMFMVLSEPLPVHAGSALIQQNNNGLNSSANPVMLAVPFPNNIKSGDVVVVGLEIGPFSSLISLGDSLSSSFSWLTSSSGASVASVSIYVAILVSSGADTVTATFSNPVAPSLNSLFVFEVSGVTTTGAVTDAGSNSGTSISTSFPISFRAGAFLIGIIVYDCGCAIKAGSGFTLTTENSGAGFTRGQFSTSGVSSPTLFPATSSDIGLSFEGG